VADDLRNGRISLMSAREKYGVVFKESSMDVDQHATELLRRQMKVEGDVWT
jgi:hypothetical protein